MDGIGLQNLNGRPNLYPPGSPLGPPVPRKQRPIHRTKYIRPNNAQNSSIEKDSPGIIWIWTIPKIIGISAGVLCVVVLLAALVQHKIRSAEKKIASQLQKRQESR